MGLGLITPLEQRQKAKSLSRYIDPANGDYSLDASSRLPNTMPPVRQRVLLAIRTVLGSAKGLPRFGIARPRKMGLSFRREMTDSIRVALLQMTDVEKVVVLQRVDVEIVNTSRAHIVINYIDLTTGEKDVVSDSVRFNLGS